MRFNVLFLTFIASYDYILQPSAYIRMKHSLGFKLKVTQCTM